MDGLHCIAENHVSAEKQLQPQKTRDLDILAASSRTLNASLEFGELLGGLLKTVKTAMRAEAVLVSVMDETGTKLVYERAGQRRTLTIVRTTKP